MLFHCCILLWRIGRSIWVSCRTRSPKKTNNNNKNIRKELLISSPRIVIAVKTNACPSMCRLRFSCCRSGLHLCCCGWCCCCLAFAHVCTHIFGCAENGEHLVPGDSMRALASTVHTMLKKREHEHGRVDIRMQDNTCTTHMLNGLPALPLLLLHVARMSSCGMSSGIRHHNKCSHVCAH